MSAEEHKRNAPEKIGCAVITVSDTRDEQTDKSGRLICELLEAAGHRTADRQIVKDDSIAIETSVMRVISNPDIQLVLLTGGTGISPRDVTIETIAPHFEKELVGFGELFRMLSYSEDIGSAAMLSRATAGICREKAIFVMPGSSGAVKLAMTKLILPEIGHIVKQLHKE